MLRLALQHLEKIILNKSSHCCELFVSDESVCQSCVGCVLLP